MGGKLLMQVILIGTSIAMVVTYVRPTLAEIGVIQDEVVRYEDTVAKAAQLNALLRSLSAEEQRVASQERRRLSTYLPDQIDDITVMRDIQNIFEDADVLATTIGTEEVQRASTRAGTVEGSGVAAAEADDSSPVLEFQDFTISFLGTYDQLKAVLARLEANAYPLEVVQFSFAAEPAAETGVGDISLPPGTMGYELTLRAFALAG